MIPLVDLKVQYKNIKKEVDEAIENVVSRADYILGKDVELFEKDFADYCGVKYAAGVDSGMSALELGIRALGIKPGDEILTPANSFIASTSSIALAGATPVLVDCDVNTYNIDINKIEKKINKKTKAIMPVHLYGQIADMNGVKKIAKKHKLFIIEDACQAHGAMYQGKRSGSFGDFSAFSFYPGKNLGAYGDGGMLVTNNRKIYDTILSMRNYGQKEKYKHISVGWNRRLDTIQAAILRVKLKYLDKWNKLRNKKANLYTKLLKNVVVTPLEDKKNFHVYHLYVIRYKKRNALKKFLESKGVGVGIHYPIPIHLQIAHKNLGYKKGAFPITEKYADEILSLPIFPELKEDKIEFIARQIKKFVQNN